VKIKLEGDIPGSDQSTDIHTSPFYAKSKAISSLRARDSYTLFVVLDLARKSITGEPDSMLGLENVFQALIALIFLCDKILFFYLSTVCIKIP
jgi:hypothetical protein